MQSTFLCVLWNRLAKQLQQKMIYNSNFKMFYGAFHDPPAIPSSVVVC